jgi:enterochelin esterase-like enzyme
LEYASWRRYALVIAAAALSLSSCAPSTPAAATPTPVCLQEITNEIVSIAGSEPEVSFSIYLPPCYAEYTWASYPALYWTYGGILSVQRTVERMIQDGGLQPFILVVPIDGGAYDFETRLVEQLVPYVDANYRTYASRRYRSVAGISTGADVAARAAFLGSETFGRVGVIGGGIIEYDREEFAEWISRVPPEQWPGVLIDCGEQDPLLDLAETLASVLDAEEVPYTFTHAPGGHDLRYWDAHMETYLQWLAADW